MKFRQWSALVAVLREGTHPCLAAGIKPALDVRCLFGTLQIEIALFGLDAFLSRNVL